MSSRPSTRAPTQRPNAAREGSELTDDAFLGGRVRLWQPSDGFRAGTDSVMLAAAVPAKPRDRVCDLGLGAGTVSLCLAARVAGLHFTGVELDPELAELGRANAARNECKAFDVAVLDILQRPRQLPRQSFDQVITNPPFHDIARGTRAPDATKARATSAGAKGLSEWLRFARALAKPSGWVTAILPPDQLPVALTALAPNGLGTEIFPLWPKAGEGAKRLIIRARMNARAPLRLLSGLILHGTDGRATQEAEAVLRRGEPLFK
jgi:tRNA1(Val) A37 N6-methylase TrmN6